MARGLASATVLASGMVMGLAMVRVAMARMRGVVNFIVGGVRMVWSVAEEIESRVDEEKDFLAAADRGFIYTLGEEERD